MRDERLLFIYISDFAESSRSLYNHWRPFKPLNNKTGIDRDLQDVVGKHV